jgi:hypothetical protein
MYKAVHWKYSNLRAPDMSAACPWATPVLWAERDGYCPEVWRVAGTESAVAEASEVGLYNRLSSVGP